MKKETQNTQKENNLELLVSPSIYYPTVERLDKAIADFKKGKKATGKYKYTFHQGGTQSSKTTNIVIAYTEISAREKGMKTTIAGQSIPHLKEGAMSDFIEYAYPYFKSDIKSWNKTDRKFTFKRGSTISFSAFDDWKKALGGKRHNLLVNEGNTMDYKTFFELDKRTSCSVVVDYNPSAPFWAHDKFKGKWNSEFFYSWHVHNPFLTHAQHVEIENIKDPELWRVYARGITGNIEGIIFPNWKRISDAQFEETIKDTDPTFGVDFSYSRSTSADPTAIVKAWIIGENLYFKELAYKQGMQPREIAEVLKANGYNDNHVVRCDHDDEMIIQMRNCGIRQSVQADKGPGSIKAGIIRLKDFNVYYNESSHNLHEELQKYVWQEDRQTGRTLNKPIDQYNHLIDACRYAVYIKSFTRQ